jgi:glycosyltransferase involved in cell wall biosynthesis
MNEYEQLAPQLKQAWDKIDQLEARLRQTEAELRRANAMIAWMKTSKFWQLRDRFIHLKTLAGIPKHKSIALPRLSLGLFWDKERPKSVKAKPGIPLSPDPLYQQWLNRFYRSPRELKRLPKQVRELARKPLISIIMPVFNPPQPFLQAAIDSVLKQVYPHWELCIADDASPEPWVKPLLETYAQQDSRIKIKFRSENGHIARSSNSALELAIGEFIALLDHDDILTPDALYEIANLINQHPQVDMIYSDEDKIDQNDNLLDPFFKPSWCPDSLLSRMYTCHLGVYRRSLVNQIGGFRVGYEGSQDYDLVLRLSEQTKNILHLPKVLYHWRIHENSTAHDRQAKNYTTTAAKIALEDALERRKEPGHVIPVSGGHHIVRYRISNFERVSIIIPTRNLGATLDTCLTSIFAKTTYPNYEVLVIDNGSNEQATFKIFDKWRQRESDRFSCKRLDIAFNYSRINNYATQLAQGQYFLFLNNDIEVITTDWLDAMVEQAQRPSIGAVGATLLYPDDTIQHAGVVQVGDFAGHSHKYYPCDAPGYFNQLQTVNNYSAVTAACLMCRKQVFEAVKGFDEQLAVAFNDIDLCLKMWNKGYRNICLPHVRLYHYESKSRGLEDTLEKQFRFQEELDYCRKKWLEFIRHDPCYSPHLSREKEDFSIQA